MIKHKTFQLRLKTAIGVHVITLKAVDKRWILNHLSMICDEMNINRDNVIDVTVNQIEIDNVEKYDLAFKTGVTTCMRFAEQMLEDDINDLAFFLAILKNFREVLDDNDSKSDA